MRAGRLRDLCTIERDDSSDGETTPEWVTVYRSVPCEVQPISGDETFRGRQLEAHMSHVVEMRRMPGILPTMRLSVSGGIHADKILNVVHVRELQQPIPGMLQLYCRELVDVA